MRLAVMADVHGNTAAFAAALADAKTQGADRIVLLGDLLMPGPGAEELFALIDQYRVELLVRGNWEDILFKGLLPGYTDNYKHVYFSHLARFVGPRLTKAHKAQLKALPLTATLELGGMTVAVSHNTRAINWGHQLIPQADQVAFDELLPSGADMALYAHTHHPLVRYGSADQLIINPGSVGMPIRRPAAVFDHRAEYALLDLEAGMCGNVSLRRVDYDWRPLADLAKAEGLPYAELYVDQLASGRIHTYDRANLTRISRTLPSL